MPISTKHYLLEAFLDGDAYSALCDKRRFSTVDNQMWRMAEVIGDGRISGWEVSASVFPSIEISPGSGLIDGYYVNSFDTQTFEISPNGQFYVFARRRSGVVGTEGPKSNIGYARYEDDGPPATMVNFSLSSISSFVVELSWTENSEVDLSHYEIERAEGLIPFRVVATVEAGNASYQDTVDEDTAYQYRAYAVDYSGNRSTAVSGSITTPLSSTPPPNPIEVAMPVSEAAVNLLWKRPPMPISHLAGYLVTWVELESDDTERPYTEQSHIVDAAYYYDRINDLSIGQKYKVILQTIDHKGRYSTGIENKIIPQATPAPRDPDILNWSLGEAPDGVEITVSWASGDDPYDPAISYRYKIYVTVDGQTESVGIDVPIGFTEEQISLYTYDLIQYFAIPENVIVTLRITSLDAAGYESFGTYIRLLTAPFKLPKRLKNVQASFDQNTHWLTITWENQPDTYNVKLELLDDDLEDAYSYDEQIFDDFIGTPERYVYTDAQINHKYTIRLTPYNIDDIAGPTSGVIEITIIADFPLPSPPTQIEAKTGDKQILLRWDQSSTPYTAAYRVYRKPGSVTLTASDWTLVDELPSTILQFTDYGLENGEVYSYYITAYDIYGRSSLHLPDGAVNLNFVQASPRAEGILTPPQNLEVTILPTMEILLTWDSLAEEFDSFSIYRSINNLHTWEIIATVSKDTLSYLDVALPLIDQTVYYYMISKTFNDTDIIVQISSATPENAIYLATVTTDETSVSNISVTDRRDIFNMEDPLAEYTNQYLLTHRHRETLLWDPDRIDLNSKLIVTDWTTVDGKIWFTEEEDISGTSYIVKVNDRFPAVFYSVDTVNRRLIFSEPIATLDTEGHFVGDPPVVELQVLGIEEVQGVLPDDKFGDLHARQVRYGEIAKEQLPDINHEGRIRETLLPKRFLLERLSNNQFIIPQGNTDTTKTFGDGTTFFALTEADGQIETVFDYDMEDDDAEVGLRNPTFSEDTISNLKHYYSPGAIEDADDIANDYLFKSSNIYICNSSRLYSINTTTLASNWMNFAGSSNVGLTLNSDENIAYALVSNKYIFSFDIATGQTIDTWQLDLPVNSLGIDIEYCPDDDKLYLLIRETSFVPAVHYIATVDSITEGTYTILSALGGHSGGLTATYTGIAFNEKDHLLYGISKSGATPFLATIDRDTGVSTEVATLTPQLDGITFAYQDGNDILYGMSSSNLYLINKTTGATTDIGPHGISSPTGIRAAQEDLSFYIRPELGVPGDDRIRFGDFYGIRTTSYLRFSVSVPENTQVSQAYLSFTAHETEESVGDDTDQVKLRVSILDPTSYVDTVDLTLESIKLVPTISTNIVWTVLPWDLGEHSFQTQLDVTELLQAFVSTLAYDVGDHIIFKIETLETTTEGCHRTAETLGENQPALEIDYAVAYAGVNSLPGGFQSLKSYRIAFDFEDSTSTRWVRLVTTDTGISPNPVIDLRKRLRFRIKNTKASFYLTLGVREITSTELKVGEDGGVVGPIEWVGATSTEIGIFGEMSPIGILIERNEEWAEVDIDLTRVPTLSFSGGNGVLSRGYGVLEHLAVTVNPDDYDPTSIEFYIDDVEQVNDLLVAGTSQGILLSRDFGTVWETARLTTTPVHKFYKSTVNGLLWAITANEVLVATDPAYWFVNSGTTGIQYIRDIVEDSAGNMYISTDKGVYWLEIDLLRRFAYFRQTQPVNAFSSDAYALYHNYASSGQDEIWVSTEIGIYKTLDFGEIWQDAGMDTAGLIAYQMFNIGTVGNPNIIGCTRKHIVRKLGSASNFEVIANFEEQFGIYDIWQISYFAGKLYVSTGSGVYMNIDDYLDVPGTQEIRFSRVFPELNRNNFTGIATCLQVIDLGTEDRLFIGQENRLMTADTERVIRTKKEFRNKELPSFFVDYDEVSVGFIYNCTNNVVCFREPQPVNKIISAAHLPRRTFEARHGGWAYTNPEAEVFIYRDGIPTWLDWKFSDPDILGELQVIDGYVSGLPALTDFNSLVPDSITYRDAVLADITTISTVDENGSNGINSTNIIQFMNDYSRFLSLISNSVRTITLADNTTTTLDFPAILLTGMLRSQREAGARAETLEQMENFEAEDTTAITIDIVTGTVDFTQAYANSTDPEDKEKYTFRKFENMEITIFNSNVSNTGQYSHREIENYMEGVNTGLTSHLGRAAYTNLIKAGIFLESQHNFVFDMYNVSNIQSKFYSAHNNDWYDILNSTVDYQTITEVAPPTASRFVNSVQYVEGDAYTGNMLWVGTDNNILVYSILSDGNPILDDIISPLDIDAFIWDVYSFRDRIYVVSEDVASRICYIHYTTDFGQNWEQLDTINLPTRFFVFRIITGNLIAGTEEGLFYCDNDYGQWFPCEVSPESSAFTGRIHNLTVDTFAIAESSRYFYRSGNGVAYYANGQITNNSLTAINKIVRFKNITYVATDKGLYNDANSILSDNVQFGLEELLEEDGASVSASVQVNDIGAWHDALYCCASNQKIYRYYDDPNDEAGNEWRRYTVPDFGAIHKIAFCDVGDQQYMYLFSYDKIKVVEITPSSGVFD